MKLPVVGNGHLGALTHHTSHQPPAGNTVPPKACARAFDDRVTPTVCRNCRSGPGKRACPEKDRTLTRFRRVYSRQKLRWRCSAGRQAAKGRAGKQMSCQATDAIMCSV